MSEDIISLELQEKWLSALLKKLLSLKRDRDKDLNEINDKITFNDPLDLAKVYIEPYCQEVNPADRHDEDFFISKEPLFKKISDFLRLKTYQQGQNQLFILSDAGMGKTSFLVMLKLFYITSFWPKGYYCVLEKLGENTISRISGIEHPRKTILLLDSLDEDPLTYTGVRERLLDILDSTKHFKKVIITCRTQFFPTSDKDPIETSGRVRIGSYICPSKYLSIFDDKQVESYLNKRFPKRFFVSYFKGNAKKEKALSIVERMASLRCRPMLLSFIEDLVNSPEISLNSKNIPVESEFAIYNSLIESWLLREQAKTGLESGILFISCARLAFELQCRKAVKISSDNLDELIRSNNIFESLKSIDIKGRSLLNRNSAGDYRFSHYSIQEFLVVFYIFNYSSEYEINNILIYPTDFIEKLINSNKTQFKFSMGNTSYFENIESYTINDTTIEPLNFRGRKKIFDLFPIDYVNTPANNQLNEDYLEIPTFLRRRINITNNEIE